MKFNRIAVGIKKNLTKAECLNRVQFFIILCFTVAALVWGINTAYSADNARENGFNNLNGSR